MPVFDNAVFKNTEESLEYCAEVNAVADKGYAIIFQWLLALRISLPHAKGYLSKHCFSILLSCLIVSLPFGHCIIPRATNC